MSDEEKTDRELASDMDDDQAIEHMDKCEEENCNICEQIRKDWAYEEEQDDIERKQRELEESREDVVDDD